MELRWTEEAARDLERITHYLFENTPQNAVELVRRIYETASALNLSQEHRYGSG